MNKASLYYTKLVAIDAIEASNINNNTFPEEERKNIVQILVQNKQVRDVLLKGDIKRTIAEDNESQGQSIPEFIIPQWREVGEGISDAVRDVKQSYIFNLQNPVPH